MKSNNFLIPVIMLLAILPIQSLDYNNIKLSTMNFGTGFVVGAAQAGINKINNIEGQVKRDIAIGTTACYAHIIRQFVVQHDPILGKESEQNQIFLSMVGQGLGQFLVEGIHIERKHLGENCYSEGPEFKFSLNISLLIPLVYRAACQAEGLYVAYSDRFWPKTN